MEWMKLLLENVMRARIVRESIAKVDISLTQRVKCVLVMEKYCALLVMVKVRRVVLSVVTLVI